MEWSWLGERMRDDVVSVDRDGFQSRGLRQTRKSRYFLNGR